MQTLLVVQLTSRIFRIYLLKHFNEETPDDYFMRFKGEIKLSSKYGCIRTKPAEDVIAKSNKIRIIKQILTGDEYKHMININCAIYQVTKAFEFSLYKYKYPCDSLCICKIYETLNLVLVERFSVS